MKKLVLALVILLILAICTFVIINSFTPDYPFGISSIKSLYSYSDYVVIGHFT